MQVIHSEHLPNPGDTDGLQNIVALANLVELGIILSHRSYETEGLSVSEHLQFISARRSSRRLVAFLDMRYEVVEEFGSRSISDMQRFWIANQLATLKTHITTYRDDFAPDNQAAYKKFKALTKTFVAEYGGPKFPGYYKAALPKRYAYPGKIKKIVDNWKANKPYGE